VDDGQASDEPTRIALVGCSGLLGDIIGQVVGAEPDLVVVADLDPGPQELLPPIDADLVLWNDHDESRAAEWLSRVGKRSCPRVLVTVYDGRDASLWQLVPRRTALGSLSPTTLLETIRAFTTPAGGWS
jgi:hypothetical protein